MLELNERAILAFKRLTRFAGLCLFCVSCTGMVEGDKRSHAPGGSKANGNQTPGSAQNPDGSEPGQTAPAGPTLRLLTNSQYKATLATLFPFANELEYKLEEDVALNGFRSIGAANVAISAKATETYMQIAEAAAERAFADDASSSAFVGCELSESECSRSFIADFGKRAFRRSLSNEEQSRYEALYQTGVTKLSDARSALKYVVMAILGSPHFLYRVELGEADAEQGMRVLGGPELASKLAYFLLNAPPDAELLEVAEQNGFVAPENLRAQASRLLASSSLETGVRSLFDDYLRLSNLESIEKLASAFPNFTPSLARAMREETLHNLTSVALDARDFRQVFNRTQSFVNQELAEFYGLGGVSGSDFVEVSLPANGARVGLLGNASLLSLYSHASSSSPTLRGKFVREALLCQSMQAPPPGVDTALPDKSQAKTTRERYSLHATNASCAGCHSQMDPIGLALENFDAIGQYRAEENGYPIDASGELDGVTFSGPAGLANALAEHPEVPNCFVRTVFRYAWGRLETEADEPFIEKLDASFSANSFAVRELLLEAVTSPEFYRVGKLD